MASSWYEDQVTLEDPVMVSTCWNDNHAEVTSETNEHSCLSIFNLCWIRAGSEIH